MTLGKEQGLYLLLCLGVFIYIVLRAINVPLTHDEVATYIHYVHQGEFIPGHALMDANNHVVNSFFSIVSDRVFGTSPLSLRLCNVLSFLVLAFYLFKLAIRFKDPLIRWGLIIAILGSHYTMEFFAMSRGYGISIAALLGSIWHLGAFLKNPRTRDGLMLSCWMFIALGANLSLLFVALFSIAIFLFAYWKRGLTKPLLLLPLGVLAFLGLIHSLVLRSTGALYYGQGSGFWEVTMKTLSLYLSGEDRIFPFIFLGMALFSLVVLISRVKSISFIVDRTWTYHLLLGASLVGIFVTHFLLDTNYPEDRVGLYLYPLLIGAFCTSILLLKERWPWIRYTALLLFYFPFHFMSNVNLDHTDFSFRERVPAEFYNILAEANKTSAGEVTLSGYPTTSLTYFFGAHLMGQEVPPMIHFDFPSKTADYVLLRGAHGKTYDMSAHDLLATDPPSGNTLWKRKEKRRRMLLEQYDMAGHTIANDEFYEIFRLTLPGKAAYGVKFDISYSTQEHPADINVVLSNKNMDGEEVNYVSHSLGWRQDDLELHERGMLYTNGSGNGEDELVLYFWNIDETLIEDIDYSITLYRLE